MSFGVDTLGGLSEKLKQLNNDTQGLYESFIDVTQRYKQGKMNEREYFARIGDYLVATSAMNFLAVRVIFEIKNAMEKGTSIKSPTGGSVSQQPQASFGIGGFVNSGGSVGPSGYTLPSPQVESSFKPGEVEEERPKKRSKNCIVCGSSIPAQAKFCSKCGKSQ